MRAGRDTGGPSWRWSARGGRGHGGQELVPDLYSTRQRPEAGLPRREPALQRRLRYLPPRKPGQGEWQRGAGRRQHRQHPGDRLFPGADHQGTKSHLAGHRQSAQRHHQHDHHPRWRLPHQVRHDDGQQRLAGHHAHLFRLFRCAESAGLLQVQVRRPDTVPVGRCRQGLSQPGRYSDARVEELHLSRRRCPVPDPDPPPDDVHPTARWQFLQERRHVGHRAWPGLRAQKCRRFQKSADPAESAAGEPLGDGRLRHQ